MISNKHRMVSLLGFLGFMGFDEPLFFLFFLFFGGFRYYWWQKIGIWRRIMSVKFTTHIKKYRLINEMTQEELAVRVNVRRETIMRLENAKYNPSLELAMRIAYVLDTSIYNLFEFNFEGDD